MKNATLITMGIGALGFLAGIAGVDGPTEAACVVLSVVSSGIFAVGQQMHKRIKEEERLERERARAFRRTQNTTFSMWLQS